MDVFVEMTKIATWQASTPHGRLFSCIGPESSKHKQLSPSASQHWVSLGVFCLLGQAVPLQGLRLWSLV